MGSLSKFADGEFLRCSPQDIAVRVADSNPTLAQVSAMAVEEQIRIGWLGNPAVDILYSLTSAGVWTPRTDASGLVEEANSTGIKAQTTIATYAVSRGRVTPYVGSQALEQKRIPLIKQHEYTLDGAGELAATALVDLLAGYFGVCRIKRVISDATDPNTILSFSSTSGIVGPGSVTVALVEDTITEQLKDLLIYGTGDGEAINISITGGSAGATIWIETESWWET